MLGLAGCFALMREILHAWYKSREKVSRDVDHYCLLNR